MGDYGVSISKTSPEIIGFQIRIVREDCLGSFSLSKQTKNEFDRDTHAPNDGLTTKNPGVHCYASKKCFVNHDIGFVCFGEHFVRRDIVELKRLVGHAIRAQRALSCPMLLGLASTGSLLSLGDINACPSVLAL
jgi:hypothetical protein